MLRYRHEHSEKLARVAGRRTGRSARAISFRPAARLG
jgi:hypothetical protein